MAYNIHNNKTKKIMEDVEPLKIMLSSSVYGYEEELEQVFAMLTGYGYCVLSSYKGTIFTDSHRSNLENSIAAVDSCDLFLGIIHPIMGTGNIGGLNITLEEMRQAVKIDKPRWFVVDDRVPFVRKLKFDPKETKIIKSHVFDPISLEAYNLATRDDVEIPKRKGNWVQPYRMATDLLRYINTQFSDMDRIIKMVRG